MVLGVGGMRQDYDLNHWGRTKESLVNWRVVNPQRTCLAWRLGSSNRG
jgi:hypothetical protein